MILKIDSDILKSNDLTPTQKLIIAVRNTFPAMSWKEVAEQMGVTHTRVRQLAKSVKPYLMKEIIIND